MDWNRMGGTSMIGNMKTYGNIAAGAAIAVSAILMLASCSGVGARISGTISDAPDTEVVVKLLDVNRYTVLDTVRTDAAGTFSCRVAVKKALPEFIYLFYGDRQVAALLLQRGEKAVVKADTLGNYTVSGSPESEALREVDRSYAEFNARMDALSGRLAGEREGSEGWKAVQQDMTKEYISYYRDRLRYVIGNPRSLTTVPVLYQTFGNGVPVFSQETDAIFFGNVCDSLATVYPDSPYVKALRQEAARRFNNMEFNRKVRTAEEIGYVDIELPDVNGVKRKLSDVAAGSKAVLVHFWSSSVALQKMFNLEVLKPVYEQYKDKGLEIYQIAIDTDKAAWARVVRDQGLGWINLCDGLGEASPVLRSYYVTQYPVSFLLVDGSLTEAKFTSAGELRSLLDKVLK